MVSMFGVTPNFPRNAPTTSIFWRAQVPSRSEIIAVPLTQTMQYRTWTTESV